MGRATRDTRKRNQLPDGRWLTWTVRELLNGQGQATNAMPRDGRIDGQAIGASALEALLNEHNWWPP